MKRAIASAQGQPTKLVDLTQDEIDARNTEIASNEAKELANAWLSGRKKEYPSFEDCVHAILDDTLEELQAKRAAVKLKYPKPL